MDITFMTLPGITAICGIFLQVFKQALAEKYYKWLPLASILLGGVLGAVALSVNPGYSPQDMFNAVVTGIVSGAAATGVHQTGKQQK